MDSDYQADTAWLLGVQRRLCQWSKANPGESWRDMWNWITDPRNLRQAWRRVACNRGKRSAGIDRMTVARIRPRSACNDFRRRFGSKCARAQIGRSLPVAS